MHNTNFKAIILAGGNGERFWPLSTPDKPKQFLDIFGGSSLIRQSVLRLEGLVSWNDIFVVTSERLVDETRREIPELPPQNVIGEPLRKDTCAAIALGVGIAKSGIIGFFSSDQLISDQPKFCASINEAIRKASTGQKIVTIGLKPTFPSTSFGYVDPTSKRFVEKPNAIRAQEYINNGYLWNAGMFIADADVLRSAFLHYAPNFISLCNCVDYSPYNLKQAYEKLPKTSFDFAVMEKCCNIDVVEGDFGWDDVGSYAAFDKYFQHDECGNVKDGLCNVVDSRNNICISKHGKIALLGVENLVVVSTPDVVLVVDKSKVADMKKLFN